MSILKRSVMTLFSGQTDPYSHQVRMVLAEKGVTVDIISVDRNDPPEDLIDLNPYQSIPTLVDRDLVLYESKIILEYLDERFPHPPLLPVYPVARAKCRLMMFRIEQDWYSLMLEIQNSSGKEADNLRKELKESLMSLAPAFGDMKFFLYDELTLVDCCLAPFLWRLPSLGVKLPPSAKNIRNYAKKVFDRESFQASLSELELEIKDGHDI